MVSVGEKTTIGGTFVSLGSETLVVSGPAPTSFGDPADPADPATTNALSILSAAQTHSRPFARVTVGKETFTAYSGGLVIGAGTTYEPGHSRITVGTHTLTVGSEGVGVGSSTITFADPADPTAKPTAKPTAPEGSTIEVTYAHGTLTATYTGSIDPSGHTVLQSASAAFTYKGQTMVSGGTTYSTVTSLTTGKTRTNGARNSTANLSSITDLPSIVYGPQSSSSVDLPVIITSAARSSSSGALATTTTSGADSSHGMSRLAVSMVVAFLAMLVS